MFTLSTLITLVTTYLLLLVAIGYYYERKKTNAKSDISKNALIYSLSLSIYCTSWTFYGSVGSAAKDGLLFLTIYLGPMITITLWWNVLRKMIRIKNRYNITSISDFISTRYGKSEGIGAISALLAIFGTIPYIALQLKSVIDTSGLMVGSHLLASNDSVEHIHFVGPATVLFMTFFTIIFGLRQLRTTEQHPGLMLTLAIEGVVKLFAFLAVGCLVTYVLNDGFSGIIGRLPNIVEKNYSFVGIKNTRDLSTWLTYLVLSSSAILFLPRQFHISVIENKSEEHVKTASWLFPTYIFLINIFVLPIALISLERGLPKEMADSFVLLLPLSEGRQLLSMVTFLGGFSAAMGMIIVSNIAITTIATNNLLLPVLTRIKLLKPLTKYILQIRWLLAGSNLFAAYFYLKIAGESQALLSIGLISFAAALQFMPSIIGSLYWKNGSRGGCYLSLISGGALWFYTLIIPVLAKAKWIDASILRDGPFAIAFLRPEELFGLKGFHPLTNAVFWSLLFNVGSYVLGSLFLPQSEDERRIADEFTNPLPKEEASDMGHIRLPRTVVLKGKIEIAMGVLSNYLPLDHAESIINEYKIENNIRDNETITLFELTEFHEYLEKNLSTVIGATAAHSALVNANFITEDERGSLSKAYGAIIADMNLSPKELNKKIILYQEKERLMKSQAKILEETIKRKELEIEEQKSKAFYASKLSALGEMAGNIAHEINNPLTVLSTTMAVLEKKYHKGQLDKERFEHYSSNINKTLERISKIVNGLRTVCRDTEKQELEEISIKDVLDDVLNLCSERIKDMRIILKVNLEDECFNERIKGDRVQLSQVLINLIGNSIDAIEEMDEKWIEIKATRNSLDYQLSVIDSGPGIAPEIQEKMFNPFFTSKPVGKGTGLGLSISNKIIERAGGLLSIDNSSPYTKFTINLPRLKKAA